MAQEKEHKRPRSVTILTGLVFVISCIYLTRLVMTISQWGFLSQMLMGFSPIYLILCGLVFSMIGYPLAAGIWRGYPWAWLAVHLVIPFYMSYYWLERIILSSQTLWSPNWLFMIGSTAIVLAWTYWVLYRKETKEFFRII